MAEPRPGHTHSLFDIEDNSNVLHVRDMSIGPVSTSDVSEFSARYHYARRGGGQLWRWGLWHGPILLGVVAYNLPTRTVCESVFGAEYGADHVWHMGRLVLAETAPRNSESRLIGGSLRAIEAGFPEVWAVVTYADTDQGHIGYVYQATNALYTGTAGEKSHYRDTDGNIRSDYQSGRLHVKDAADRGWTRHPSGPKHRYVYLLGNKTRRRRSRKLLRYEIKSYPKGNNA